MKCTICIFTIFISCLCSCRHRSDVRYFAEQYCSCMRKNRASEQYEYAKVICDAELMKTSYYYKIVVADMVDPELKNKLSQQLIDSALMFYSDLQREIVCKNKMSDSNSKDKN